ncbi:ribosome maturation factor RimP [Natribacillus halophilus]|uniref:Ribosome maturation factor RimP n=1 Tax=Natribacillus halophilus TaxID=549003 RepID=A0A1G8PQ20_9BACI|nr:ribosome maturation factor RimP [Natribacillus halophilus]SDI94533.1 ribosome maturation factor RimP [Natribacillus halophilus]
MANNVKERAAVIAQPILDDLDMELVDIEYKKEGQNWVLRVFIDNDEGVGLEECSLVSERLSQKLDEEDPIPGFYYLEVSSPGAERPLKNAKDFEGAVGKNVYVKTYEQVDGKKVFEGLLTAYEGGEVTINIREKTRTKAFQVPERLIATARLSVL